MIMLCERCYGLITDGEHVLRLAHVDRADTDGNLSWVHSYVHTGACAKPRPGPGDGPDTGSWDPSRGIPSRRP